MAVLYLLIARCNQQGPGKRTETHNCFVYNFHMATPSISAYTL